MNNKQKNVEEWKMAFIAVALIALFLLGLFVGMSVERAKQEKQFEVMSMAGKEPVCILPREILIESLKRT